MKKAFSRVPFLLLPGLLFLIPAAPRPAPSGPRGDVVLITIDTLRADYLGCYGNGQIETPTLDALAADGVLFERAYCQVPLTPPSHASILTGSYPASHGLRDFTSTGVLPSAPSLASILKANGYQTAAFVSAFVLDESWGLGRGFDLYYDEFPESDFKGTNPGNIQRRASETIDRVLEWLVRARGPIFLWVHLFDPHHDYNPPEPFHSRYRSNLYAGEVAYADSQLARLIEVLKKEGRYRRALILATSDHGESLGEHGEQEHGFFLYEPTLHIPLIIKLPRDFKVSGKRLSTLAQTIDLAPTVLQVLRIPLLDSWHLEGHGLLSAILGKRTRPRFAYAETLYPRDTFGWSDLRVFRHGDFKFIEAPRPELYDLSRDPGESHNLFPTRQALALQLRRQLQQLEQTFSRSKAQVGGADTSRLERLSALGYLAVDRPVALRKGARRADPKQKIGVYNQVLRALQAAEAGRFEQSNRIFSQVARQEPDLFIVHYSMGLNQVKMRRPRAALASLARARSLNPDFPSIDLEAAQAHVQLGEVDQAVSLLERLTRSHPEQIAALRLLASLYGRQGRLKPALDLYHRILKRRPQDRQALKFSGIVLVRSRHYRQGLERLNGALRLGLEDALLRNFEGIALSQLGQTREALAAYRRALRIRPSYPQARLNLALALRRLGKKQEASQEFQRLCREAPALCRQYRQQFEP